MKKDRPKIAIEKSTFDNALEIIAWAALAVLILYPMYYYTSLPETIPVHFNASGEVDGYGGKKMLLFLVAIGTGTFFLLRYINKKPENFNYPVKITEENAKKQYEIGSQMIRFVNAVDTILFAYIIYLVTQIGLGNKSTGSGYVMGLVGLLLIGIFYYVYLARKHK